MNQKLIVASLLCFVGVQLQGCDLGLTDVRKCVSPKFWNWFSVLENSKECQGDVIKCFAGQQDKTDANKTDVSDQTGVSDCIQKLFQDDTWSTCGCLKHVLKLVQDVDPCCDKAWDMVSSSCHVAAKKSLFYLAKYSDKFSGCDVSESFKQPTALLAPDASRAEEKRKSAITKLVLSGAGVGSLLAAFALVVLKRGARRVDVPVMMLG